MALVVVHRDDGTLVSGHDILFKAMKSSHKKVKHIGVKLKESRGWKPVGIVKFETRKIVGTRAQEIDRELKTAVLIPRRRFVALIKELDSLCPAKTSVICNLVVQAGRNVLAGILNGELTYTGIINYGALGTSATAVTSGDTTLGAEVKRKQVATRTRSGSQINFDFYYSKSDVNGTFEEFGMFIDGTATVDTGQMFNHLLTGGWTKSSSESLTASVQLDLNAS